MLSRWFELERLGTDVRTELLAGLTTFLGMVYIVLVNPNILAEAGIDPGAAFVATCLAAAIGSLIMGLAANYPIALAPGMGLNAYFTYGVVKGLGYSWEVGLGAVFLSGCAFLALSLFKVRQWLIDAIPAGLKHAISAGIGLFLGIIALKNAGVVTTHGYPYPFMGDIFSSNGPVGIFGFYGFALAVVVVLHSLARAISDTIHG